MTTLTSYLADSSFPLLASTVVDLAIKVAFVLALAAITTRMLWRSSAALRHSVWTAAIAGALLLPLVAIILPVWHLPIPGVAAARALAARVGAALGTDDGAADVAILSQQVTNGETRVTAQSSAPSDSLQLAVLAAAAAAVPATGPVHVTLVAPSRLGWRTVVAIVWVGGALLALVPLLLGLLHLRTIGRRARDVESDALDDYAAKLGRSLGIGRVVRVVEGDAVATPMTWGIITPVVLVPAGFSEWPEARRRDVLLHELAHVARYDCLTQYLASIVCALHWYNPLAWLAARNLRIERERACDDRVLLAGARASEYAEHLLTIARTLRTPGPASAAALAMARPSHLEGRLLAVLDAGRRRATLTRRRAALVGAATFGVVAVIATLAPWSARRAEAGEPDHGRFLPPGNYMTPIDTDSVAVRDSSRRDGGTTATSRSSRSASSSSAMSVDTVGGKIVRYGPASTIVLNTGPKAIDPSAFALAGCSVTGRSSSSAEVNSSDDEHLRARVKRGDCEILLEREGEVGYNSTFTDVVSVAKDGWFEISDRGGPVAHKLRIVADDNGNMSRIWSVDGTKKPYDAAAATWLRETLLELDRYTDFSNGARMAAAFKEKGANGVLDEVANTESDYGKRTQIEKLLKMARLDRAQTERILGFATSEMSGDYEKSQLLQALLTQDLVDPTLQSKYIAAASTISGDYERRQALSALANKGKLTAAAQVATYNAAKSISGSYDRAQLIGSIAKNYGLTAATAPAFTAAAETMDSDYDLRTLLATIVEKQPNLDSEVFADFLSIATRRISSDYDKAEFLIKAAGNRPNTEAERERIAKAAESISSESDYGRVLASLRRLKNGSGSR